MVVITIKASNNHKIVTKNRNDSSKFPFPHFTIGSVIMMLRKHFQLGLFGS